MNIIKDQIDEVNAVVDILIEENDYKETLEKKIRDLQKKAVMKGFRQGNVPKEILKKNYWKQLLVNKVVELAVDALDKYIKENNIKILCKAIIKDENNWDEQKNFKLSFDLGLQPDFTIILPEEQVFTKYIIKLTDDNVNETINLLRFQFGTKIYPEISGGSDKLSGKLLELDDEEKILEGGINRTIIIDIKTFQQPVKDKFIGLKKDDTITLKFNELFRDVTWASSILDIPKEKLNDNHLFQFSVENIEQIIPAELNQEFFDKMYGKNFIKNTDDFLELVKKSIIKEYKEKSETRLKNDIIRSLFTNTKIILPDEFLKRYLQYINNKITPHNVEYLYPIFARDVRWQLIKMKIAEENNIKITIEDIKEYARENMKADLLPYCGFKEEYINNEFIENYIDNKIKNLLEKQDGRKDELDDIYKFCFEKKILDVFLQKVKIKEQEVTYNEFIRLPRS